MSISLAGVLQLFGGSSAQPVGSATSLSPTTTAATDNDGDTDGSGQGSTSSISQIMNQLQQLSQTNPTEFAKVTSDISTALQQDASQSSGSQATFLSNLASQFEQASQSGNLSSVQIGGGHHHHHGGGGGSSASALLNAITAAQNSSGSSGSSSSSSSNGGSNSAFSQLLTTLNQVITQDLGSSAGTTSLLPTSA